MPAGVTSVKDARSAASTLTSCARAPVDEEFEIPEGYKFITGFALGYADPDAPINSMQAPRPSIQLLEGK